MHYYQFNIGDYVSHTRHLTPLEDAAYRRLLDAYYLSEKPLSGDAKAIARQIGMREYDREVSDVLSEFFQVCDEGWRNVRADKEIAAFKAKQEQASRAGKASAERRFNGRSTEKERTSNQPLTINHKPRTINPPAPKGEDLPGFTSFWETWPTSERKQAKGKCLEAWKKAGAEKQAAQIVAHVERMKVGEDWKKNGGAYIPAPLVYLNQRRWEGAGEVAAPDIFAGAI